MKKKRYCLALDLKNEPKCIAMYRKYHERIWPVITTAIRKSGITDMEIYLTGNRLFMIMETDSTFSFTQKTEKDMANPRVQEWENLMSEFQQPLAWAEAGQKRVLMDKIFELEKQ